MLLCVHMAAATFFFFFVIWWTLNAFFPGIAIAEFRRATTFNELHGYTRKMKRVWYECTETKQFLFYISQWTFDSSQLW